jgi:hypothetical protein
MMSIAQRSIDLRDRIKRVSTDANYARQAGALTELANTLAPKVTNVLHWWKVGKILGAGEVSPADLPEVSKLQHLKNQVSEIESGLATDPLEISKQLISIGEQLDQAEIKLRNEGSILGQNLITAWRHTVATPQSALLPGLVGPLRTSIASFTEILNQDLPVLNDLESVLTAAKGYEEELRVSLGSGSEDLKTFMKRATSDGAPLNALTPALQEELTKAGLIDYLIIQVKP